MLLLISGVFLSAASPVDVTPRGVLLPFTVIQVEHLSGGELQRVALCVCLGKPADVYLIDEPSAYLDSEQRVTASKVRHVGVH